MRSIYTGSGKLTITNIYAGVIYRHKILSKKNIKLDQTSGGGPRRLDIPITRDITNRTKNKKNSIFAIPAAAIAIPPKPKAAAINAMIKKTSAQLNMIHTP